MSLVPGSPINSKGILTTVAVVSIVVGGIIGGLIPPLGIGNGTGKGKEESTETTKVEKAKTPNEPVPPTDAAEPPESTKASTAGNSPRVLQVVIDGRQYFVSGIGSTATAAPASNTDPNTPASGTPAGSTATGDTASLGTPVTLENIVAMARECRGDELGIRVRVTRRRSSLAAAENDLRDTLRAAGFNDDQVDWLQGPRP